MMEGVLRDTTKRLGTIWRNFGSQMIAEFEALRRDIEAMNPACPERDCRIKSPHTHGTAVGPGLADGDEEWVLVEPRDTKGIFEHLTANLTMWDPPAPSPHAIKGRLIRVGTGDTSEAGQLRSQLAGVEALARLNEDDYEAQIRKLSAENERLVKRVDTAVKRSTLARKKARFSEIFADYRNKDLRAENETLRAELAEIKRVLIGYHRQEGDGILSVKRLAKRFSEQTAGGTRLPAEIPADYPAGSFSPAGTFSDGEEAGP